MINFPYIPLKSKTILDQVSIDIPIEIYGHILKLAGNIPLLRSVCKDITKAYEKEIIRYNLTAPITKNELIGNTSNPFWLFIQDNKNFIEARGFIFRNGWCLIPNNSIRHDNGVYNIRLPQLSYKCMITKKDVNCDIKTIYNIIKKRSIDSVKYIKSLLINTINYYDQHSSTGFMLVYLFCNLCSFGLFMLYNNMGNYITSDTLFQDDLNYTKNLLKDKLIERIQLIDKHCEQHKLIIEML